MRTDLKPLKRTGRCKDFLDFDRRAAVTGTAKKSVHDVNCLRASDLKSVESKTFI